MNSANGTEFLQESLSEDTTGNMQNVNIMHATLPEGMENSSDVLVDTFEHLLEEMENSNDVFVDTFGHLLEEMENSSDVFVDEYEYLPEEKENSSDVVVDTFEHLPEEMENSSAQPSTSAAVLSEEKPSSPTDTSTPNNPSGSFDSLYEVGKKLAVGSDGTVHKGIRRSDGTPVVIKFVKKCKFDKSIELAGHSKPLCHEAFIMQMLEHSNHVIKLHDWFDMKDRNILIMEYPHTIMTLCDFINQNGGRLTEALAKDIMQKLIAAIEDCSEQGVYHNDINVGNVLIIPHTTQIKLTGFGRALTISESRRDKSETERGCRAVIAATEDLYRVLQRMVQGQSGLIRWFWFGGKKANLSKECLDLLQKLCDRDSGIILQNILDHDWFNNTLYESSDGPSLLKGTKLTQKLEHFKSLYKVGRKLEYGDDVYEGIRRSNGLKVTIKFWEKYRSSESSDCSCSSGCSCSSSDSSSDYSSDSSSKTATEFHNDADMLLKFQMAPSCDHFMRLYDRFITEDHYILVMEHLPPAYVTFEEFRTRSGGSLTEETAKNFMSQLYVAIRSCIDKDGFHLISKKIMLINTETLHIKLSQFGILDCKRAKCDYVKNDVMASAVPILLIMKAFDSGAKCDYVKNDVMASAVPILLIMKAFDSESDVEELEIDAEEYFNRDTNHFLEDSSQSN